MCEIEEPEIELEEQFILRLPLKDAEKLREILQTKPDRLKKTLKLDMDMYEGTGIVSVGKKKLYAYLRKFPTIIESYKTNIVNDKSSIFKTANVSHMLECFEEPIENYKKDTSHGYSLPLKNVKKKRFRKTLTNPEVAEETEIIAKELYYLLSTDLDAVYTRFELINEENKNDENIPKNHQIEKMLFGHVSSSDSEYEIEVVE